MKDAVATMGGLLPDDTHGRDAVHVAVFSARSAVTLYPGQRVAIVSHGEKDSEVGPTGEVCAMVDPFLDHAVMPGERFWAYLFPRTITALAHRWSHPAFEQSAAVYVPPSSKLESEKWLRDFCATADCPSYEAVVAEAANFIDGHGKQFDDEYLHFDGRDAHGEIPPEFWTHMEMILGRKGPETKPTYFSCSC